jgi:hypothetical protein
LNHFVLYVHGTAAREGKHGPRGGAVSGTRTMVPFSVSTRAVMRFSGTRAMVPLSGSTRAVVPFSVLTALLPP